MIIEPSAWALGKVCSLSVFNFVNSNVINQNKFLSIGAHFIIINMECDVRIGAIFDIALHQIVLCHYPTNWAIKQPDLSISNSIRDTYSTSLAEMT